MKVLAFLLLFIVLGIIVMILLKKRILDFLCALINKKIGLSVQISTIKISFTGIYLTRVIVEKHTYHAKINAIRIRLTAHRNRFIIIEFADLNVGIKQKTAFSSTVTATEKSAKHHELLLRSILNRLPQVVKRTIKFLKYAKVKGADIIINGQDHNNPLLLIRQFEFERRKIVLELEFLSFARSKYIVIARLTPTKILYTIRCLKRAESNKIMLPRLSGKLIIISNERFSITANADIITLNDKNLSYEPLSLKAFKLDLILDSFADKLELNSDSSIQFNTIHFNLKYIYDDKDPDLFTMLLYFSTDIESLINLIPKLQLQTLKDLKSEGQISVGISLAFLWSDPLHYNFSLDYDFDELKIKEPGVDLHYLHKDFHFEVIINPEDRKTIKVASSIEMNELLAKIIQQSEDPNFYKHQGVDINSIGVAISTNLARKCFFKGASTISMQLVKNLFLAEDKFIIRKLEELILTLLMENHFHISKKRILEIYLQVIEFGPGVYGVHEASKFYFNKAVTALNLTECLVLSYIIPRPRFFLAAVLAKSEQLNQNLSSHIISKAYMLLANQLIGESELKSIDRKIEFYKLGCFELTKLNLPDLRHLPIRSTNI